MTIAVIVLAIVSVFLLLVVLSQAAAIKGMDNDILNLENEIERMKGPITGYDDEGFPWSMER